MSTQFSSLALKAELLSNLETLGYTQMTPIQAQSLPPILDCKDVIGQAKTGSGKTAAFALGVLNRLDVKRYKVQVLIICPTRELADQVAGETRRLARGIANLKVLTLCGGVPYGGQISSLEHGAHIIVGTPGRLEDHLRKERLKLDAVNMLVLDEADRMLDMGFRDVLNTIVGQVPGQRQTLLFSATFPEQIKSIASEYMRKPVMVRVREEHDKTSIEQNYYKVSGDKGRLKALRCLLASFQPESSLVFCNTKRVTQDVADALKQSGIAALALHGDMEQAERDLTLIRFANKSVSVLVATDVAARGLDINQLDAVFNYHVAHEAEIHTHRIGRTGRAGSKGRAFTLFEGHEFYKLALLGADMDDPAQQKLPLDDKLEGQSLVPPNTTIQIGAGKKRKLRPGDILGALTGEDGINAQDVGKINVLSHSSFVAVANAAANKALIKLSEGKLKGRSFRARKISN